ncbi:hypothetical protein J6590_102601, partial [Homalodisca vitripennis]
MTASLRCFRLVWIPYTDQDPRHATLNYSGDSMENALCTVRDRYSPWCVGLSPTKNLPVQALETISGTHLCNYFKRNAATALHDSGLDNTSAIRVSGETRPIAASSSLLSVSHILHLKKVCKASSASKSPYWHSGLGIFPILL